MPIWKGSPVHMVPEIELVHWRIYEVSSARWLGRTRHLVGYNLTEGAGRVSSAIISIDPSKLRVVTLSGRVYQLVGTPGSGSNDGEYVWQFFREFNELSEILDVTQEMVVTRAED